MPLDLKDLVPIHQEDGLQTQPAARPSGIEKAVCEDIARRQAMGIAKYGTTVEDNPLPLRDWLQHAYEETLDKAIYLKRAIAELDKSPQASWGVRASTSPTPQS